MFARFCSLFFFAAYLLVFSYYGSRLSHAAPTGELQITQDVSDFINGWAQEQHFNGVIAIQYGDEPFTALAFGIANPATQSPITRNSVFQTGSIDKWFASIAVFTLIEDDVLKLHEPIGTYIKGLSTPIDTPITLHDLMSNRSGLSDDALRQAMGSYMSSLNDSGESDASGPQSLDDGVAAVFSSSLKFTSDAQFDYVNANWVLVHHILEQVTDQSYGEILKARVFSPAGMTDSGVFVGDLRNASPARSDIAIGFRDASEGFPGDYPLPAFIGGGSFTSVADIARLQRSLDEGESLTPMTIEQFRTVTTPDEDYAYGGYIVTKSGNRYSWQSGSNGATNVVSVHCIDGDYTFVAASNTGHSQDALFELAAKLESKLATGVFR